MLNTRQGSVPVPADWRGKAVFPALLHALAAQAPRAACTGAWARWT